MIIKLLLLSAVSVILCSCSYNRYIDIKDGGVTSYANDKELSKIIKSEFPFLTQSDMGKYHIYLSGEDESLFIILTIRKGVVTVTDSFFRESGHESDNPKFHEFIKRLQCIMKENGTSVEIGEPYSTLDLLQ